MKREEIKKHKKESILYQLGKLKLMATKVFGRALKKEKIDLTPEQVHLLGFLFENESCFMNEIANELMVDNSAVTRLVDGLETKRFAKRTISKQDRRQRLIEITEQGKEEICKTVELTKKYKESLLRGITQEEKQDMLRLLEIMHKNSEAALLNLESETN